MAFKNFKYVIWYPKRFLHHSSQKLSAQKSFFSMARILLLVLLNSFLPSMSCGRPTPKILYSDPPPFQNTTTFDPPFPKDTTNIISFCVVYLFFLFDVAVCLSLAIIFRRWIFGFPAPHTGDHEVTPPTRDQKVTSPTGDQKVTPPTGDQSETLRQSPLTEERETAGTSAESIGKQPRYRSFFIR